LIIIRSSQVFGPTGLGHTTTVVAILDKPDPSEAVAADVARTIKTSAPEGTFYLLVLIVGDLTAAGFAVEWQRLEKKDKLIRQFMFRLSGAQVIAGRQNALSSTKASLITSRPTT
jgi:hypothetical protein